MTTKSTANPFHYGSPVSGAQFVGRAKEVRALESRIRNHINVVLVSPRRYRTAPQCLRLQAEGEAVHARRSRASSTDCHTLSVG